MRAQFTVKINLGNEAMQTPEDVALALLQIAGRLEKGATEGSIRDVNGNLVGSFVGGFEGGE